MTVYDIHGNKIETRPRAELLLSREVKIIHSSFAMFDKGKSTVKTSAYRELKKNKGYSTKIFGCGYYYCWAC